MASISSNAEKETEALQLKELEKQLGDKKNTERQLRKQKQQHMYRNKVGQNKVKESQKTRNQNSPETIRELQKTLHEKDQQNKAVEADLVLLQEELQNRVLDLDLEIPTMIDARTLDPAVREASYRLQGLGVAESKVSAAIDTVLTVVANKQVGRLPSTSTQHRLGHEMLALSRQQVRAELAGHKNTTLKYDGTSKKGAHLSEVEIATADATFLAGNK